MNYKPIRKDDFDKSFKYNSQSFLCYSGKKLRELSPEKNYTIVGYARKSDKNTENKLVLGGNLVAVFEKDSKAPIYKSIGYIPVSENNEYIAVQQSRVPFVICMGSMAAVTAVTCAVITNITPPAKPSLPRMDNAVIQEMNSNSDSAEPVMQQFNPLPPVDVFVEDYADAIAVSDSEKKDTPEGGGKVTISYKPEAKLDLSEGTVTMEYQNPASSSHDAVLDLYVVSGSEEYLIASSGRIPSGKQLKTMQLSADKGLFGGEGKYNAMYRISYYDPTTGEALAEANIDDINLMVRK